MELYADGNLSKVWKWFCLTTEALKVLYQVRQMIKLWVNSLKFQFYAATLMFI